MRVTLRTIADATGYARSTVGNVLTGEKSCRASPEAREKILATARRLHYKPNYFARGLRRPGSALVGVVGRLLGVEVFSAQFRTISSDLMARGYMPLIVDSANEETVARESIEELLHRQVEGLIVRLTGESATLPHEALRRMPCILITAAAIPGMPCIIIDRAAATRLAVERLLALGHRRIAFAAPSLTGNAGKLEGYRRAMAAAGLFSEDLVHALPSDSVEEVRRDIANCSDLFRSVTAVVASNDDVAAAVMLGLRDLGRSVPTACSVVGFDDGPVAQLVTPALTTMRQPREEVGRMAVEMCLKRISGKAVENVTLVAQWIERDSTAPCRR